MSVHQLDPLYQVKMIPPCEAVLPGERPQTTPIHPPRPCGAARVHPNPCAPSRPPSGLLFSVGSLRPPGYAVLVTVDTFKLEIAEAMKAYDTFVVCLDKTTEECQATLLSLVEKAIRAYENRGTNLRHGIALDRHLTVILSQSDSDRPLCAIYFNLHSPYYRKPERRTVGSQQPKRE